MQNSIWWDLSHMSGSGDPESWAGKAGEIISFLCYLCFLALFGFAAWNDEKTWVDLLKCGVSKKKKHLDLYYEIKYICIYIK